MRHLRRLAISAALACSASLAAVSGGVAKSGVPERASGRSVPAPVLTTGDTWTYVDSREVGGARRVSHDTLTLVRADPTLIAIEVRPAGSTVVPRERLLGPNWSVVRSVNGRQTVVNQPLAFPLAPGKSWTLAYTEFSPANRSHTREQFTMTYRATDWESVTVPAGTFRALKIVGDGTWTADVPPSVSMVRGRAPDGTPTATMTRQGPRTLSGRYLKTFWYVPDVRRWIKSEEDSFDVNGTRTEHTTAELEAFSRGDGHLPLRPAAPAGGAPGSAPAIPAPAMPPPVQPVRPGGAKLHEIRLDGGGF